MDSVRGSGFNCSSLEKLCRHFLLNQASPSHQDMGLLKGSFWRLLSDNEVTLQHPYPCMLLSWSPSPFTSDSDSRAAEGSDILVCSRIHHWKLLKVQGPNHHGGGTQGVAGAFEVVPLDTIELSMVLSSCIEHPIEIGGATGIKPPAWKHKRKTIICKARKRLRLLPFSKFSWLATSGMNKLIKLTKNPGIRDGEDSFL